LDKAHLLVLGWNDWTAARREIEASLSGEDRITYADTYFEYWPYWGRRFKLRLLEGDLEGAEALAEDKFSMEKWYGPYVGAYLQSARGECAQAEASSSTMLAWGPLSENLELLHFLSRCRVEQGRLREAAAVLRRVREVYGPLNAGSVHYTKSLMLLGHAYEGLGERSRAREAYEELVSIWKQADPDLPDLIEARRRLAQLAPPRGRD
jgi:tetratricopeptide (TPR) repeat protein